MPRRIIPIEVEIQPVETSGEQLASEWVNATLILMKAKRRRTAFTRRYEIPAGERRSACTFNGQGEQNITPEEEDSLCHEGVIPSIIKCMHRRRLCHVLVYSTAE